MAQWDAPEEFVKFVHHRHVELLRFAHVLTGDQATAEDLVQDALERTGTAWRRVQRQDDPEGYVRRIIVNRHLNRIRALRREKLVAQTPDRGYVNEVADDHLWSLLASLPCRQRAVLVLRYYLDLSEPQVAAMLDCSVGTVKSNSSRAMAKLRRALAGEESQGDDPR